MFVDFLCIVNERWRRGCWNCVLCVCFKYERRWQRWKYCFLVFRLQKIEAKVEMFVVFSPSGIRGEDEGVGIYSLVLCEWVECRNVSLASLVYVKSDWVLLLKKITEKSPSSVSCQKLSNVSFRNTFECKLRLNFVVKKKIERLYSRVSRQSWSNGSFHSTFKCKLRLDFAVWK